jgi:amino acid permease
LPYVFALNGWATALVYIWVGAFGGDWSNYILAFNAVKFNERNYYNLCVRAGGKKLGMWLTLSTVLYVLGSLLSYQIIMTSLIQYVMVQFGMSEEHA